MAKTIIGAGASTNPVTSNNVTRYISFIGGDNGSDSTVTEQQIKMPVAGTARRMGFQVTANTRSTNTTIRFAKNGSAGSQVITLPGGVTGTIEDTSNSDSIAANDLVCASFASLGGGGLVTVISRWFEFEASSGTTQVWTSFIGGAVSLATAQFWPVQGYQASPSEASARLYAPGAGTWSHLSLYVSANSATGSRVLSSRVNGAAGNQTITVSAGATGLFEDTTHSDTLAAGDLIALSWASGVGTGPVTSEHVFSRWSPNATEFLVGGVHYNSAGPDTSNTTYWPFWGRHSSSSGTVEQPTKARVPFACQAKDFRVRQLNLTAAVDVTYTVRINGSNSALTVTCPAGTSGTFTDAANVVALAAGDDLSIAISPSTGDPSSSVELYQLTLYEPSNIELEPAPGELELQGFAPLVGTVLDVDAPGALELQGYAPAVQLVASLSPAPGALELEGLLPELLITATEASQLAVLALSDATSEPEASQLPILVLGEVEPVVEASQLPTLVLAEIIPEVRASELAVLVLCDREPCVAREAQLWTITRRDGRVFRFTSLDVDFPDGEVVYESCGSLQPSASESTTAGQPGDIELEGLITSEQITEDDLLAGLFDDAYVEVWLVPWNGRESRRRLAAGWTGNMSRGDTSFRMEVLGPTSRLQQKALLEVVAPSCGHILGDGTTGDGQCGYDIEGAKRFAEVEVARNRGQYRALIAPGSDSSGMSSGVESDDGGIIWENGYIRWINGRNAGQVCEVKSVNFTSGEIVLWSLSGFLAEPGDNFYLYPGCTKDREACKAYGQILNFGGFPDVPGEDAISQTPEAKL